MRTLLFPAVLLPLALAACADGGARGAGASTKEPRAGTAFPAEERSMQGEAATSRPAPGTEIATFGAGCYWCVEAVLEQIDGVLDVRSGFMGGKVANPTYEQVCTGRTGHAEVVQVTYDPKRISYAKLLGWFWKLHDPTTPDRQGDDAGTQYRSAIFYHSEDQKKAAEASRDAIGKAGVFSDPIVTEIVPAGPFYSAEGYHQDYYRGNKGKPYCRLVISPKLEKLGLEK